MTAPTPLARDGTWRVDPEHSSIEFRVRHLMIEAVRGRFVDFGGSIESGEVPLVAGSIGAASLETHHEERDAHLRSPDFLDVGAPRRQHGRAPARPRRRAQGDPGAGRVNTLMKTLVHVVLASATAAIFASASSAATGGGTTVKIGNSPLGRILVDSKGITLYDFPKDKGIVSSCYGACAALWPPLLTTGKPHAGSGVRAALLGTTKRSDGKLEVTYAGHPLYYFVTDRKPGQITGQALDQFGAPWWILTPAGKEIHRAQNAQ